MNGEISFQGNRLVSGCSGQLLLGGISKLLQVRDDAFAGVEMYPHEPMQTAQFTFTKFTIQ